MPEYRAPGVYVEEVERGAKPIEGVSTSVAGLLGRTERGPTEPRLITSFADFKRIYGSYVEESYLAYAVEGFFVNGGGSAYVGRIADSDTGTADGSLVVDSRKPEPPEQTEHLWASNDVLDFGEVESSTTKTVTVDNVGKSGDSSIAVEKAELETSDSSLFDVTTESGSDISIAPSDDPEGIEVTYNPPSDPEPVRETLTIPHDGQNTPVEVELRAGSGAVSVDAVGPGTWGGHVAVIVDDSSMFSVGDNQLFKLTLRYWADEDDLAIAKANDADPEEDGVPDPDVEEVYDDLSPNESSSNYYVPVVRGASNLVDLSWEQPGRPAETDGPLWLDGPDSDGTPATGDWNGDADLPPDERTGFAGLDAIDDISIYCVPDEHADNSPGATAIRDRCLDLQDRFAILQAEQSPGNPGEVTPSVNSDYTAFYYPWVTVLNSETGNEELVPPGGHVAGVYARSDGEHGVHKAPANEVLRGVQSLQFNLAKGDQDQLNPRGVNCIRSFRGRGIRVWGARTTSPDPSWKYVNVRRLFLYLRESIDEGTQWVVFEPNDEDLWARVEQTIRNFLTSVWEDGALMGTTPEEAFYVKCDRTTMTQNDIDNGRLICEIGVAPVKPAEFVVFRIGQWTGSAE